MAIELTLLSRVSYGDRGITGPRLHGLLALLAGDLRTGCGTGRLVEGLWPDERPEMPTKALQVLVSRVRAQLGSEVIVRTPTGYRLALSEDQVDTSSVLLRAASSTHHATSGDHEAALAQAEAGLALWDGAEVGDSGLDDPLSLLRAERAATYRALVRARALALSRLGRHAEAVEPLTEVVGARPRDEETLLELLRCEATTIGPAAALTRYDTYRRALREELGTDPGAPLQSLHLQLLNDQAPPLRRGVAHEPNPLLGRDQDIAAVQMLLRTARVTSIVGVGGLGKTRLANVVSRQAEQRVVQVVALAGVTGNADVAGEVATVLGVGESPRAAMGGRAPTDVTARIVDTLGQGPALLVLDNCEHVLRGAAELVRALVSMTRDVRVLTTSRAPLGLSSESVYLLPELDLPTSVVLFEQRARAARPGVDLNPAIVTDLCRHLDGLPLAVELAAARVRVMSIAEIARGLADRFGLLRGGARDAPARHDNLHAVVDWSWHLVESTGQAAMRALSVFPGGFTEDAARQLLGDSDILRVLESLVDQSLLKVTDTPSGTRLRMLETVREFSTAHREAAGETDRVTDRFLAWARDFGLSHAEPPFGADPVPAVARIRAEQDNLVLALRLGLARNDGATVAATAAALGGLWLIESNFSRLTMLGTETAWLLSHFRPEPEFVEVTRAAAAFCTGNAFALQGPRAVRSLVILRGLPPAAPDTLLGAIAIVLSAAPEIFAADRSALDALCAHEQPLLAGVANLLAGYRWELEGDLDDALGASERMLAVFGPREAPWLNAVARGRISELCLQIGQGDRALRELRAVLPVLEELGELSLVIGIRWALAMASLQVGDIDEAEHWWELTALTRPEDSANTLTADLAVRAEILLARGEIDAGLRLWRRALDRLRSGEGELDYTFRVEPADLNPWELENQAVTVIAHARNGHADLVADVIEELSDKLARMLRDPMAQPPVYVKELLICGTVLLALGVVDLDSAARTGQECAARSGVRLVALAERFGFLRNFQPTMSAQAARQAAEKADRSAYQDAVSQYADLDHQELRAAALAVLRARQANPRSAATAPDRG